ncbi:MAG TPA: carbonic anhydrase [Burkholderiales bacterium]|nr:carbonic anhydrase [Burkholderiales bacterium]
MQRLLKGIVDFHERLRPKYAERFRELAFGQSPDVLFITCSDSRVVPELLASSHPGDLFTMRNVGNLVPPATGEGLSTGDVSEASAIEYAVLVLGVSNIVVCGHSECGAMRAVLARAPLPNAPNLGKWLNNVGAAAFRLDHEGALDPALKPHDQLSQLNVLVQIEHLMSYPIVRERASSGALHLSGWWFDIENGDVYVYEPESRSFEVIDRQHADRLIARFAAKRS